MTEPAEDVGRVSQILAVAAELFASKGFEATSIRDIAEGVGISKPTIYHYFTDKSALYIRIIVTGAEQLCRFTEQKTAGHATPAARFRAFVEGHAQYFAENRVFYVAANFGFAGLRDQRGRAQVIKWRDRHEANLRRVIQEGLDSGEFAGVSAPILSRAVLSCLTGMARWHREDGALSAGDVARLFSDLFLNGALRRGARAASRA